MALPAVHGLVRGSGWQGLTAHAVRSKGGEGEIDALLEQIANSRTRLQAAREISQIGDLLALIYRCEDRIKAIKRGSRRQKSPAHALRM